MLGGIASTAPFPAKEPLPAPGEFSVWAVGDIHQGRDLAAPINMEAVRFDLARISVPALTVQVGDMTEASLAAEDTASVAWHATLPSPRRVLVGNHDMKAGREADDAIAAWNINPKLWTYDAGFALMIGVNPDVHQADATILLPQATLDWLAATLAAATKDCWIFCHAPLEEAAYGAIGEWCVQPTAGVLSVLAAAPRAKAWISGHTHTDPMIYPEFAKSYNVGGGKLVANINSSAIAYVNPNPTVNDPVRVFLLSRGANVIQVRIRDCVGGYFVPWPEGIYAREVAYS